MGDQLYLLGFPWLVYDLTKSAKYMALMSGLEIAAKVVWGIVSGVFVDRFSRRSVLVWSLLTQAVFAGLIPVLSVAGALQVGHLFVIAFILTSATVWYQTAFESVIPSLVAAEELPQANAKVNGVNTAVRLVGPSAAGLILVRFGVSPALLVDSLSFLPLVLVLLVLALPPATGRKGSSVRQFFREAGEGLKYVLSHRVLNCIHQMAVLGNIGVTAVMAILLFHLRDNSNLSSTEVGSVFTAGALGGLLASFLITPLMKRITRGAAISAGAFITGVGLMALGLPRAWWGFAAAYGVAAIGTSIINILYLSIRQTETPAELQGRVAGAGMTLTRLPGPVAMAAAGWAVPFTGATAIFWASGLIVMASGVLGLRGLVQRAPAPAGVEKQAPETPTA